MRPLLFFLWALVSVGVVGCGEKSANKESGAAGSEGGSAASQLPPSDVTSKPGSEVISDVSDNEPIEGLSIYPVFDEAGATTLSVVTGETIDVLLYAKTVEPYSTNAAQLRVDLPPGLRITGVTETPEKTVSSGSYSSNYMLAYNCQPAGKFLLVTLHCIVEPDFRGGEVAVAPGLPGDESSYLGFSTCDFNYAPAVGAKATIKKK